MFDAQHLEASLPGISSSLGESKASQVMEADASLRNPPFEGRATPLKDNPVTEEQKAELRKAFGPQGDALVNDLFREVDTGVQVGQNVAVPKTKEKPQGFWAQLIEGIKNFFRNLFR
ncbi:MAG: hypothetical protein Q7U68_00635 [Candidatus Roizmanbacteria bacterium]|nr:hypothetical protein [Candidatus Roizmanbacteria bacterium]